MFQRQISIIRGTLEQIIYIYIYIILTQQSHKYNVKNIRIECIDMSYIYFFALRIPWRWRLIAGTCRRVQVCGQLIILLSAYVIASALHGINYINIRSLNVLLPVRIISMFALAVGADAWLAPLSICLSTCTAKIVLEVGFIMESEASF